MRRQVQDGLLGHAHWRRLVEHILKDHSQEAMSATTFDTLEISKRLKEAGLPEAQAEAVTAAIRTARTRPT